jgi:hypothetical protein
MKNIVTPGLMKYFLPERIKTTITNSLQNKQLDNLNKTQSRWKLRTFYFNSIKIYVSRPVVKITRKSVNIYLFYYTKKSRLNRNSINNLGEIMTRLYIQPVQLRLIRLSYPFLDAHILRQYIRFNRQDYKFVNITNKLFGSLFVIKRPNRKLSLISKLPSHILGLKIRISGRLTSERSRPRFTVQTAETGTFSKNNLSLLQVRSSTAKNKKNRFTVKVWLNQRANVKKTH